MKEFILFFCLFLIRSGVFAQSPAPQDTLLPRPSSNDTMHDEKKLPGGALIDTVNTKEKAHHLRPVHPEQNNPRIHPLKRDSLPTDSIKQ